VSKAAMHPPETNSAPRGAHVSKKGSKTSSPPEEATAAKRVAHRSRSPCAQRSRSVKAFTEGVDKRERSLSRKSEDESSSRSTSSRKKRHHLKKTTPKSR
jgi:hypothetical protein